MEYFNKLFAELTNEDSIIILVFLFFSFLFGLLAGWFAGRGGQRQLRREVKDYKDRLAVVTSERDGLQEHNELDKADIQRMTIELDEMREQLDLIERERNAIIVERQAAQDQLRQLQLRSGADKNTIEELNDQILGLRARGASGDDSSKAIVAGASSDLPDRLANLENEVRVLKSTAGIEGSVVNLDELSKKVDQLELEHQSIVTSSEDVHIDATELANLAARVTMLEEHHSSTRTAVTSGDFTDANDENTVLDDLTPYDVQPRNDLITEVAKSGRRDDLTQISGISDQLQTQLNSAGIYTYDQISNWGEEEIEAITYDLRYIPGRIMNDDWVGQAKLLCNSRDEGDNLMFFTEYKDNKDLTIIKGIDDGTADTLRDAGIATWQELADTDAPYLEGVLHNAGITADPEHWPAQARLAVDEMWRDLEKLKKEMA